MKIVKRMSQMLYPKNVPTIERVLRVVLGIVMVSALWWAQPSGSAMSPVVIGLLLFSAAFVVITGFVGWCPACAMIGRKLK
jgi:hypothetical protein